MKVGAAYARQSVEKKNSLSISGQLELCQKMAGSQKLKVYQDAGYSGKNTARPAFQRLLRDIRADRIAILYVYRLDRFSRSIADFGRLWEILQEHQVEFVSVNENFDTSTPMGRAMLHIIMVFAQLERETTAERVRDNYYRRVLSGAWPGGPAPFGYRIGREPGREGGKIPTLVQTEAAAVVREVYARYAEETGASLRSIARALQERAVGGKAWNSCAVSRMLQNPVYVQADEQVRLFYLGRGVPVLSPPAAFDGLHGGALLGAEPSFAVLNHAGIVPAAVWLRCQERLAQNRQIGNAGRGTHSWLSGLLKCAECGYSLVVQSRGERRRLSCSGRYHRGMCRMVTTVQIGELEKRIEQEIQTFQEMALKMSEERETAVWEGELHRKKERLLAAFAACEEISGAELRRGLRELEREQSALRKKAGRDAEVQEQIPFAKWGFAEKKAAAGQFIERVLVGEKGAVIRWNV